LQYNKKLRLLKQIFFVTDMASLAGLYISLLAELLPSGWDIPATDMESLGGLYISLLAEPEMLQRS
jgi:hypothetical protein